MSERRRRLLAAVRDELEAEDAGAVVHAGTARDPSVRYALAAAADESAGGHELEDDSHALEDGRRDPEDDSPASDGLSSDDDTRAVALDGDAILSYGPDGDGHPAARLADRLADRGVGEAVLAPAHVPHDAALYLESAEFSLASTGVLERARAAKTAGERERIERTQAAASAGVRRAAAVLAEATVVDGGLAVDGEPLSADRLRRRVDAAVVEAGAFPVGNTTVTTGRAPESAGGGAGDPLRPGEPIVIATAPRGSDGYHGGLARTLVVGSDGTAGAHDASSGWERRARVALTGAFASARALLAGGEETVRSVEADLEAEIRAFGFEEGIRTTVAGVGLAAAERPRRPGAEIESENVVRIDASVTGADGGRVRVADLVVDAGDDPTWLEAPERTLEPASLAP